MESIQKILVLGIGQSNFLDQLYEPISLENTQLIIDVDGYNDISKGKSTSENNIYNNFFDFKKTKIGFYSRIKMTIQLFFLSVFWRILFFEISQQASLKNCKKVINELSRAKYIVDQFIIPMNYDLIHFHFCTPENLRYMNFLPMKAKTICSFWGSDLLRNTGISNVFYVQLALNNASAITIQTRELAEILYCKYGRIFANKTKIIPFTISTKIYEFIDLYLKDSMKIEEFKFKYGIPIDKKVIVVSHNAFKENNHILILEELKNLQKSVKEKIVVVLPLAYGGNPSYINELILLTSQMTDFKVILLFDYLNAEEVALFRLATDVLIQMPISDALSGAMTEVLYAENKVISGSWLPYGILKRKGIEFVQIENFHEIQNQLNILLAATEKSKNAEKIKSFLFPETTTPLWKNLFKKVMNE